MQNEASGEETKQTPTSGIEQLHSMYPNSVPVIVRRSEACKLPDLVKQKFLVPNDTTVGQFLCLVRARIKIKPEQALFFLVNDSTLPATSATIDRLYDEHQVDGVLLLTYKEENTFG